MFTQVGQAYGGDFSTPWLWPEDPAQVRRALDWVKSKLTENSYDTLCVGVRICPLEEWNRMLRGEAQLDTLVRGMMLTRAQQPEWEFEFARQMYEQGEAKACVIRWQPAEDGQSMRCEIATWSLREEEQYRREYDRGREILAQLKRTKVNKIKTTLKQKTQERGDSQSKLTDNPEFPSKRVHILDNPREWAAREAAYMAEHPELIPDELEGVLEGTLQRVAVEAADAIREAAGKKALKKLSEPKAGSKAKATRLHEKYPDPRQGKISAESFTAHKVKRHEPVSDCALGELVPEHKVLPNGAQRELKLGEEKQRESGLTRQQELAVEEAVKNAIEASLKVQLQRQLSVQRERAVAWDKEHKARLKAERVDAVYSGEVFAAELGWLRPEEVQAKQPKYAGAEAQGARPPTDKTKPRKVHLGEVQEAIAGLGGYKAVFETLSRLKQRGKLWQAQGVSQINPQKKFEPKGKKFRL